MLHSMLRQDLKKDKKIRKTNICNLRNNIFKNVDFLIFFVFLQSLPQHAVYLPYAQILGISLHLSFLKFETKKNA